MREGKLWAYGRGTTAETKGVQGKLLGVVVLGLSIFPPEKTEKHKIRNNTLLRCFTRPTALVPTPYIRLTSATSAARISRAFAGLEGL